jgi:uncharacterized protein (TIGR04255 family)
MMRSESSIDAKRIRRETVQPSKVRPTIDAVFCNPEGRSCVKPSTERPFLDDPISQQSGGLPVCAMAPTAGMTTSPKFNKPPVVETALSIQFKELRGFRSVHFGQFHTVIQGEYPHVEDHPRLGRIAERFPQGSGPPQISLGPAPLTQRTWFRDSAKGGQLVQLQADRFAFNWRQEHPSKPYPSYSKNSEKCFQAYDRFLQFCDHVGLGPVEPDHYEVVYVNHIVPRDDEKAVDLFEKVFVGLDWVSANGFLPRPESATLNRTFTMPDNRGRLYAEAHIATAPDKPQIVRLNMIGRVVHRDGESVGDSMKLAHDWVVHGFVSVTREEIRHKRWEQSE